MSRNFLTIWSRFPLAEIKARGWKRTNSDLASRKRRETCLFYKKLIIKGLWVEINVGS